MKLDQYSNPTNISPEPDSQVNSTSHLRKDSYPSISNFSKKTEEEGILKLTVLSQHLY